MDKTDILQSNVNGISNGVNTRIFIVAFLVFFLLAPAAYAAHAIGEDCSDQAGCIASTCDPTTLVCVANPGTGTIPGSAGSPPGGVVPGSAGTPPSGSAGPATTLINPLGNTSCSGSGTCLSSFLASILKLVVQIGAVVVVLMLVYVGFLFVVARGDPGKITTARTALLWTVIGALVLLGAQAIASGIQATIQALGG